MCEEHNTQEIYDRDVRKVNEKKRGGEADRGETRDRAGGAELERLHLT